MQVQNLALFNIFINNFAGRENENFEDIWLLNTYTDSTSDWELVEWYKLFLLLFATKKACDDWNVVEKYAVCKNLTTSCFIKIVPGSQ